MDNIHIVTADFFKKASKSISDFYIVIIIN